MAQEERRLMEGIKLHPMAVALVESLIKQGRAGDKPFGIPLSIWVEAIEEGSKSE